MNEEPQPYRMIKFNGLYEANQLIDELLLSNYKPIQFDMINQDRGVILFEHFYTSLIENVRQIDWGAAPEFKFDSGEPLGEDNENETNATD